MLGAPITHDISLEGELPLENIIQHLIVVASIGIIDKIFGMDEHMLGKVENVDIL